MINCVNVALAQRSYPIHISEGILSDPQCYPFKAGDNTLIVTNPTIAQYHLNTLITCLQHLAVNYHVIEIADGEQYKNLETFNQIISTLLRFQLGRDTTVIALGGGVIGDIAGLVAATYQRGVRFIQIPTTLLAQVDSSVGGKTAVNHPLGKNMIGAFYQPNAVIIDSNTLATLPKREFNAGLAEVIKYGAISDVRFFEWLEQNIDALIRQDKQALQYCIARCCQIKADIVSRDETEQGERALLNFGHTFGHAIEAYQGYGRWLHGEAVAVGMLVATTLSYQLGHLSQSEVARIEKLIARANLPTISPDNMPPEDYLPYMLRDKKVIAGQLRLILLKKLGQAYVSQEASKAQLINAIRCHTQT